MDKFDIDIDIGESCNLRCPPCPQGNIKDYSLPRGFMEQTQRVALAERFSRVQHFLRQVRRRRREKAERP